LNEEHSQNLISENFLFSLFDKNFMKYRGMK
jgi:hypothetical protein